MRSFKSRRYVFAGALLFSLASIGVSHHSQQPSPWIFKDSNETLTLDDTGQIVSLVASWSGKSLISKPAPFSSVLVGQTRTPVSKLTQTSDGFQAEYGSSGVTAKFTIQAGPAGIAFQVSQVQGSPDTLTFVSIPYSINFGRLRADHMAMRRGVADSACIMSATPNVDPGVGPGGEAVVNLHKEYGFEGAAILVASPSANFMAALHAAEVQQKIPFATVDGQWCKASTAANDSYLFVDAGLQDIPQAIKYAQEGGFGAIMIIQSSWTKSVGSYQVNTAKYPGGMADLQSAAAQVHAAGLKFGLHATTPLIQLNDPLFIQNPGQGMVLSGTGALSGPVGPADISVQVPNWTSAGPAGGPLKGGDQVVVDSEAMVVQSVAGGTVRVARAAHGTKRAAHGTGSTLKRLAMRYGGAVVDLNSPTKDQVENSIANAIQQTKADMFYFDGSESVDVEGPLWYTAGQIPMDVWNKVGPNLLVMGSAWSPWSWHIFARSTAEDFAQMAVDEWLDRTKIPNLQFYAAHAMPAELGWVAILPSTPAHPATNVNEMAFLGTRMIAYNVPCGIEANMAGLKQNSQTDQLLSTFKFYDDLRKKGVPASTQTALQTGRWTYQDGGFVPVYRLTLEGMQPGSVDAKNDGPAQTPAFELSADPGPSDNGGPSANLLSADAPVNLASGTPRAQLAKFSPSLDLSSTPALKVQLSSSGPAPGTGVVNLQLSDNVGNSRDYVLKLGNPGDQTVVLTTASALREVPAAAIPKDYQIKRANSNFDFAHVAGLFAQVLAPGNLQTLTIKSVDATGVATGSFGKPTITVGGHDWASPAELSAGCRIEWDGHSSNAELIGADEKVLQTIPAPGPDFQMPADVSSVSVKGLSGHWRLTLRTIGQKLPG